MGTKHDNKCADNAADDEPIFTLRAQDRLAPTVLQVWITLARIAGTPAPKLLEAMSCLRDMEEWQRKQGSKIPD